jgi:hypothetical protein
MDCVQPASASRPKDDTSHHKTHSRPLPAYPRTAPACAVIIIDVRPTILEFPAPLSDSLVFIQEIPLGDSVNHFVQKSSRQEQPFLSLALSRRALVGPHAVLNTALDGRVKTP